MKKTVLSVVLALGIAGANAQDLTSKKGEPILPEASDWAISVEATPFLNYFGNMLSSGGNTAPTWNHLSSDQTIIGKMFKDEKTAYRGILRIGMNSSTTRAMVEQAVDNTAVQFPALIPQVEDSWKQSSRSIGLGAGIEMRRGKTRLQGFYGADAMIWLGGTSNKYTYGNALAPTATIAVVPTDPTYTTNFGNNIGVGTYNNSRMLTSKNSVFGFGVRGFIGAEYFVFPKISFGGEFGWGLGISSTSATKISYEAVGGVTPAAATIEEETSKSGGFRLDTDRNWFGTGGVSGVSGVLRANFHF